MVLIPVGQKGYQIKRYDKVNTQHKLHVLSFKIQNIHISLYKIIALLNYLKDLSKCVPPPSVFKIYNSKNLK